MRTGVPRRDAPRDDDEQLGLDLFQSEPTPDTPRRPKALKPLEIPYDPEWRVKFAREIAPSCYVIDSNEALASFAAELAQAPEFAFDVETTGLDYKRHRLVGLSFAMKQGEAFYIPVKHTIGQNLNEAQVLLQLAPSLSGSAVKIAHNAKFDLHFLLNAAVPVLPEKVYDTYTASVLCDWDAKHGLKDLAKRYLAVTMTTYAELFGADQEMLGHIENLPVDMVARYAVADADCCLQLKNVMESQLDALGQRKVFNLESRLLPVVLQMEEVGIAVDLPYFMRLQEELQQELDALQGKMLEVSGYDFDPNSPQQIADILFSPTKLHLPNMGYGKQNARTDERALEKLRVRHPVVNLILEYREKAKILSTYISPIIDKTGNDGRIRPQFRQLGAITGRFSCREPNFQSVPKDSANTVRYGIWAESGNVLIAADYSQIELRVLAHLAAEDALLDAFSRGVDVHKHTAAKMFSVPYDAVTPELRHWAKGINFGLVYGMSAKSLAQMLNLPETEGERLYKEHFRAYPKVREYLNQVVEDGRARGYVETLFGRRRYLPELNAPDSWVRLSAERKAQNSPVQGTAADIIKLAMIRLHEALNEWNVSRPDAPAHLTLQVHDELVVEGPESHKEELASILRDAMCEPPSPNFLCPLEIDLRIGKRWAEET